MNEPTETETAPHHHGYISNKDDYLKRLRRIEGNSRGLQSMVTDEKYCIPVTNSTTRRRGLKAVADPLQCRADWVSSPRIRLLAA
ncbi:metal-sensitive transcriptional regulator [Cryobacterium psychrophilum]|uniref:Metal-sensitive transcriptional regulator n=1 Tax=Cryobacterium psychrophilum TaxID=41988 RepID=A0A4Y8KRK9_9MICO|nr:metal-sensitive transcriptional repressor [Cryobacterium psychrophilum]TFD76751.1 metal-sensitive transcriptional regulator [Cryobacterium psychrophilum]